ncbi:MAG: hypothetical protein QOD01_2475, partial [Actinomycetota bacterium]|nr:hypothetical protein [Actinomycetota bacterium]
MVGKPRQRLWPTPVRPALRRSGETSSSPRAAPRAIPP